MSVPRICTYLMDCTEPAVAIVSHPTGPRATCADCIKRLGLADRVIAAILAPPDGGEPVVLQRERHADDHIFLNVCICPCAACATHTDDGRMKCTCPLCPSWLCGSKAGVA